MKAIVLFINLIWGISNDNAQTGSIKGKIITNDGHAASYVNVTLKELNKGTTTNDEGVFQFRNLSAGKYEVVASFVGLQTQSKTVEVLAGVTTVVDFTLSEDSQQLSAVVVTGGQTLNEKTSSIGKVAIKPMDLPQSVMVLDQKVLERQQVQSMKDALMNANGVYIMGNTGGYQEEIAGRGFAFNSTNTFKNGVRFFNGIMPEMSSLEKIEILKGSSAILFGNVAAGGIINLISKKPKFETGGQLALRVGSFDFYKPTFDVYGAVLGSEKVAYRINGSYEKANSFRDNVSSERIYVNPSLLWKIGKKTEVLLEADYLKDNRTLDFGTVAINYALANIPRNRFLGVSWGYYKAEQKGLTTTITHKLSENWQLRGVAAYQNYANDLFGTLRPNGSSVFVKTNGNWTRGIQKTEVAETYLLGQLDLTGNFTTGNLKHTFLLGTDFDRYDTKTTAYNNIAKYDSINVFNLDLYKQRSDIPTMTLNTVTQAPINRVGVYVQDLLEITPKIKALVGVRYSYQQTGSSVFTNATQKTVETNYYDGAFTPRLGLVYQPSRKTSFFTSYANSFTLNTGTDISGNALPPSFINQFELGVKNEILKELLSFNVTAYQIVNSNLAQTSLANGNTNTTIKELAGEVTSKGLEIDVMSRPFKGLSLIAGYSYNETRYTKSNIYIEGSLLKYNPNHTANASMYYTFSGKLRGFNVGLTALYFGDRVAGRSTRLTIANDTYKLLPLAAFTQIDISAGYTYRQVSLRVKLANVGNELSYFVHDDNSVNPIAPRNVAATLAWRF